MHLKMEKQRTWDLQPTASTSANHHPIPIAYDPFGFYRSYPIQMKKSERTKRWILQNQTLNTTLQREIQFQTIKSKKYKRKNQNVSKTCAGSQPGFSYPNSMMNGNAGKKVAPRSWIRIRCFFVEVPVGRVTGTKFVGVRKRYLTEAKGRNCFCADIT